MGLFVMLKGHHKGKEVLSGRGNSGHTCRRAPETQKSHKNSRETRKSPFVFFGGMRKSNSLGGCRPKKSATKSAKTSFLVRIAFICQWMVLALSFVGKAKQQVSIPKKKVGNGSVRQMHIICTPTRFDLWNDPCLTFPSD